jgi:hypothetical protein
MTVESVKSLNISYLIYKWLTFGVTRHVAVCLPSASGTPWKSRIVTCTDKTRRRGTTPVNEFWRTVREAIESNAKTLRLCMILLVIAIVAWHAAF